MQHIRIIFGRGPCTPADLTLRVFCVLEGLGVSMYIIVHEFTNIVSRNKQDEGIHLSNRIRAGLTHKPK